ncbi:MAG: hypothetical protein CJD30_09915 [Sulfuricurvum sp. PD_MW2]|uniref:mercuric transporter MerT family protein n=1 Tax=Sulfuricurvum sp. PD_MW2 TaxID=2027917 RepID=UPI000C06562C|nr:mercuric transporter MerT family protein [Sulfuricurvum sp. PD_MW2]PHM16764.1 MAG: hypothetical protein CJD30_09915 [Sulfuricurvum sp. PD_MW2]
MKQQALWIFGAFISAVLSASCCLIPTLFIIFGISFAGLSEMDALIEYRWAFSILTVGLLTAAGWIVFKPQTCSTECCTKKRSFKAFLGVSVLILMILLYPVYEELLWSNFL